jgi:hypothetical protein
MLVVAVLAGGVASSAAAKATPKDCGKLEVGFGGVGKLPKGVPAKAKPEIDAFRVRGKLGCKTVRSVMQAYEHNQMSTLTQGKPPAPGWSCKFDHKVAGDVCKKGTNEIEDQFVYKLHGKIVGPRPRTP